MTTTAAPAAAVPPRIFLDTRRRLSGFPFAQVQCKMSTSSCLFDALSVESVDDCHFGGIGRSLLSRRVSSRSKKKRRKKEAKVEQRNFSGKVQSLAPLSCVCFFFSAASPPFPSSSVNNEFEGAKKTTFFFHSFLFPCKMDRAGGSTLTKSIPKPSRLFFFTRSVDPRQRIV